MIDAKKDDNAGKEQDPRGSRFAQDLPGAALGDRAKFNKMISEGQKHPVPPPPKAYPNKMASKTRGGDADNDTSGMADFTDTPGQSQGAKPGS